MGKLKKKKKKKKKNKTHLLNLHWHYWDTSPCPPSQSDLSSLPINNFFLIKEKKSQSIRKNRIFFLKIQNSLEKTGFLGVLGGAVDGWALETDDYSLFVSTVFSFSGSVDFTARIDGKRRGFLLKLWGSWERHENEFCENVAEKAMGEKRDLEVESIVLGSFQSLKRFVGIRNDESLYF